MSWLNRFYSPAPQCTFASTTLLLLRLVMGLAFMLHGWGKIQTPFTWMGDAIPSVLQFLAAISEFGGGLLLVLGLFTSLGALAIACTMTIAVSFHLLVFGDPFVGNGQGGSYELALVYLAMALVFIAVGPGRFSLDQCIFGKCCKSNCSK